MIKNFFFRNASEAESIAVLKMVNPEFKNERYSAFKMSWMYVGYYKGELIFCDDPDDIENCIFFEYVPTKEHLENHGIIEKKKTFADLKVGDFVYFVRKRDGNILFMLTYKETIDSNYSHDLISYKLFANKSDAILEQHRILQSIFDEKLAAFKEENKDLIEILNIEI